MRDHDRLEELLRLWQQGAEQPREITPEELCHDCPDLLPLLRDRIAALHLTRSAGLRTPEQNAPAAPGVAPTEPAPQQAHQIPGFQVEGELGHGGMGIVLRARELALGRPLAVKVLLDRHDDNPQIQQRFLEEAQVMGQLQHPGVPAVHQLGQLPDGRPFFSMKLVRGQTLAQLLRERQSPADELPRLLSIFAQVCETVAYAHSRGILHRDLKPSNIMVGAFGEVQVMDWGLAKVVARGRAEDQATPPASTIFTVRMSAEGFSSQAGTVVGTPAYMAIEQARGEVAGLDERADVFGLGAILCELLTGEPPYRGGHEEAHWQAARGELADAFARLQASGAEAELLTLAKDCLAKERDERPRDSGVVAERMTVYQRGVQERLRQAEMAQAQAQVKAAEERKRRRVQLLLAGVVLLLILAGGVSFWWVQQQRQAADAAALQAMAKARLLLDQAKDAPLLDVSRFTEALSEAHKAEQLAQTGRASADIRQQATELARRIGREKEAAQRDQRLLAELLAVPGPDDWPTFKTDQHGAVMRLAVPTADEEFVAAFRAWGLDVDGTSTAAAVARLKDRAAAVVTEVIAALDEWASRRRLLGMPVAKWRHLASLAEALDSPDSRRRELRALLARDQLPWEHALGMLSMALRPVPIPFDAGLGKDRGRLQQLVAQTDAAREPVLGLLTLSRALYEAGEDAQAERLLKAAVRVRPQEVVLHHLLGQFLTVQTPPRWDEALECYVAVRALRPGLGDAQANALMKLGRVEEGLALYEQLTRANPRNPWLHLRRGGALCDQGRFKEAVAAYREATRLWPKEAGAHYNLGLALVRLGQSREAEAVFRKALLLQPAFPEAQMGLGTALLEQGRIEAAVAAYRAALRLKSRFPDAYHNLSIALHRQRRFEEAEEACRAALQLKADFLEAHLSLGAALAGQGCFKEAEAAYRQALRLKPNDPLAHSNLGDALKGQRRFKEAEAEYRAALRRQPDHVAAHNGLAILLGVQGRFEEAEALCRAAIRLERDSVAAHNNLGIALRSQGRFEEAEAAHREAIRLKPEDPHAHSNLGAVYLEQRRTGDAETAYRKAISLQHDCPEAHTGLGNVLAEQRQFEEAEAAYHKAICLKPNYPEAHTSLAIAFHEQGRYKEAEAAFRKAIRHQPDYPKAHYNLGNTLNAVGRFPEAEAAFREAIRVKPNYAQAHCNLGARLAARGRYAESLEAFRRGHALGSKVPGWRYPSAQWVREAERRVELEARLPAFLDRAAEPSSAAECLQLASMSHLKRLHAAEARFVAAAFAAEPKLATDLKAQHRYNGACSAALAAAGQGEDAGSLTDKDRAALRQQALQWLRADLTLYEKLTERDDPKLKQAVTRRLAHWQGDADLAAVRDPEALGKLSEAERDAWRRLWADVAALRRHTAAMP
jgi:serine/threonine-protein kinase